jgi:hypothetical protein
MVVSNKTLDVLAIIGGIALVIVILLEKKRTVTTTGDFSRMDRGQA